MQMCENYPVMQLVKVISLCTNAAMFLKNRFDQDDTINEHQHIPLPLMDNWRLLGAVLCVISKSVILILIPFNIKNSWKICVNVDTACWWWLLDSPKVSLPGVRLELGLAVGLSDLRSIRVSVNTTSAPSATCLCRLLQPPARNWPSMYSFFAQKWYGLLSFWAVSWLRARML